MITKLEIKELVEQDPVDRGPAPLHIHIKFVYEEFSFDDEINEEIIRRHISNPEGRRFKIRRFGNKKGFWPYHWAGTI